MISRRSLFRGLGAILAAPAVAKVASLIPPVEAVRMRSLDYLKAQHITRDAIRLWSQSNSFLYIVNNQFDEEFGKSGAKVGSTLRIRLPSDYRVTS